MAKQTSTPVAAGPMQLLQELQQSMPFASPGELASLLQLERGDLPQTVKAKPKRVHPLPEPPPYPQPVDLPSGSPGYPPASKDVPFLYNCGYLDIQQQPVQDTPPPDYLQVKPFAGQISHGPCTEMYPDLLLSWEKLWPLLHAVFSDSAKTRRLDECKIIRAVLKQQPLTAIPWQKKEIWAGTMVLLADFSPHLSPFFKDYEMVVRNMQAWFGDRLRLVICPDAEEQVFFYQGRRFTYFPFQEDNLHILYLGDLGFLHRQSAATAGYYFLGRLLQQRQARIEALLTAHPAEYDPELAPMYRFHYWENNRLETEVLYKNLQGKSIKSGNRVEKLLAALSTAFEITPALVRKLRIFLGMDVSVESLVFQKHTLSGNGYVYQWQSEKIRRRYQDQLAAYECDQQGIWQIIASFEKRLPFELQVEQRQKSSQPLNTEQKIFLRRLLRSGLEKSLPLQEQNMVYAWIRRAVQRSGQEKWCRELADLCYLYTVVEHAPPLDRLPAGVDLSTIPAWIGKQEPEQQLSLCPGPGCLDVLTAEQAQNGLGRALRLKLMANKHAQVALHSAGGQFVERFALPVRGRISLPDDIQKITISTRATTHTLAVMRCPSWATSIGRDRYGLFAEVAVAGVRFCLRWIPPGSFLMGSPEDEPERFYDEGPQHRVRFEQGFWFAEIACTQELWQAVMGGNPSRFSDNPQNPVESVSRKDVLGFIKKLNSLLPGLALRLPSEAEWEYGCRGGTGTPFWFGHELTTEVANYDGREPYNDGPEGEYREHTLPVKSFQPNPWGLYQVHGNVWEWCADNWHDNYQGAPADGSVWEGGDIDSPVARGGSWISHGWILRSACRRGWHIGHGNRGFRLARGPESGQAGKRN